MPKTFQEPEPSLAKLSIGSQPSKQPSTAKKGQDVADSWEDEESDVGEDTDRPISSQQSKIYPAAPPPTPISPATSVSHHDTAMSPYGYGTDVASKARNEQSSIRPEKTDAAAKRMIAGALGVKAPKRTEEQMAYDKAIREKEVKRRNLEKEAVAKAKEEEEAAKAAVWSE